MKKAGVTPDVEAFNQLMEMYAKASFAEGVEKVLVRMKAAGVTPDKRTFMTLMGW